MNLKLKKKCHIVPPDWLTVGMHVTPLPFQSDVIRVLEFLQDRLSEETSETEFSRLPFRFAEIAKVILDVYEVYPGLPVVSNLIYVTLGGPTTCRTQRRSDLY